MRECVCVIASSSRARVRVRVASQGSRCVCACVCVRARVCTAIKCAHLHARAHAPPRRMCNGVELIDRAVTQSRTHTHTHKRTHACTARTSENVALASCQRSKVRTECANARAIRIRCWLVELECVRCVNIVEVRRTEERARACECVRACSLACACVRAKCVAAFTIRSISVHRKAFECIYGLLLPAGRILFVLKLYYMIPIGTTAFGWTNSSYLS